MFARVVSCLDQDQAMVSCRDKPGKTKNKAILFPFAESREVNEKLIEFFPFSVYCIALVRVWERKGGA